MSAPLLEVRGLGVQATMRTGPATLVRDVDFVLGEGETLGVVGESGSGKSMLMKAVLSLLPPRVHSSGEVRYRGDRIDQLGERRLRALRGSRLSLLLQDPFTMLNPVQTVGATIAETLRPEARRSRAHSRIEVARRLEEVGLDPSVAAKRPFQLSGGMRQRVAIAASLAADPEVLVADEPTTALDVSTQDEVLRLLRSLRTQRGLALILITHDLRVAFDVCDHVMVMYAGSVLEQAPAAALRDSPMHPYTAALMDAEPAIDQWTPDLSALPGSVPASDSVRDTCAFAARCEWVEHECETGTPPLVEVGSQRASRCRRTDIMQTALRSIDLPIVARPAASGSSGASPLLQITGLRKTYHTTALVGGRQPHTALRGVDISVGEGEAVGLVGESGSGKTTIARSVLGLSTPDEGTIVLDGIDISDFRKLDRRSSRSVRQQVQAVFQDPYASLNPKLTIGQTLTEAIEARGGAGAVAAQVGAALERVNLPRDYARRLPAGLSGGERQRVSIARAVCLAPRLLICDEPVAALDVSVQAQILELLRSLREELGMAMLLITHDLAVVRQMTERVLVLAKGEVVESGETDSVIDAPQHPYTRSLIAAIPGHVGRPHPSITRTSVSSSSERKDDDLNHHTRLA
jgi:peptide/nickel transport system ATP-binding protein